MDSFPNMQKAQRAMDNYMNKSQGQVSSILKRSDPINIPKRIHPETMTFGSVPLKRLNDFENGDMPEENPKLQRQSGWVAERCDTSPTSLASMLAEGRVGAMQDLYPSADSYAFNFSAKKLIDQNLYVYYVGI